jgi:hypothetical protein
MSAAPFCARPVCRRWVPYPRERWLAASAEPSEHVASKEAT